LIWLLLTGAGFVAETVIIVALGRRAMANDGQRDGQVRRTTSSVAPSDQAAAQ
jgi:hypothetical protein